MPIYAYRCATCGHAKDVLQKMSDPLLTVCPECGASTFVKQVTAAGFQLKGSGWYVTDFRDKAAPAPATGTAKSGDAKASEGRSEGGKSDSGSSDSAGRNESKGESKSESKSESTASKSPAPSPSTGDSKKTPAGSPPSTS